jgi:ribosomal protein S18 acetylase RimI-like enzyme
VKVYKDKLGFETVETRIAEYGEGEDRLVMVKAL